MNKTYYSWEDLKIDTLSIISQVYKTNWMPHYIVGIKRGGLVPAVVLSHNINAPMYIMNCQLRDGAADILGPDSGIYLSEPMAANLHSKILLVDDICDSGDTFERSVEQLMNGNGFTNIKTCCLIYNTRQKFIPDFYARKIDRKKDKNWISFPWEVI